MEKPDVDQIDGLSPAISIDQKSTSRNRVLPLQLLRKLRLPKAALRQNRIPHCPIDNVAVVRQTRPYNDQIAKEFSGKRLMILSPIIIDKKEPSSISRTVPKSGFARVRVDGIVYSLDEFPELDKAYRHRIDIVIDRLVASPDTKTRLVHRSSKL